jgi:hypothetical protein
VGQFQARFGLGESPSYEPVDFDPANQVGAGIRRRRFGMGRAGLAELPPHQARDADAVPAKQTDGP